MIYFNNPASTFNITILINLSPKRPAPKSHVSCVAGRPAEFKGLRLILP